MVEILEQLSGGVVEVGKTLASGTPLVVWLMIGLAVFFLFFGLFIHFKRKFDFEGTGHQLGHYMFNITGKYPFEANVAEWDEINDYNLDLLASETNKDFEVQADVLRQMRKEGNLFIYTAKITDDSEIQDELEGRTYIISPVDLDDKKYYYESQASRFTWRTFFQKEKTRFVTSLEPTDVVQVYNEDRNYDTWFILIPLERTSKKEKNRYEVGFNGRVITDHNYGIDIKHITNANSLANTLSYLPYVIKTKKEMKVLLEEDKAKEEIIEELSADVQSKNQTIQRKNRKLGAKQWIIISKTEKIKEMKINMMWVIGGVIAGAITPNILETFLPNMNETSLMMMGLVVAIVIMALSYKFFTRQKPEPKEDDTVVEE